MSRGAAVPLQSPALLMSSSASYALLRYSPASRTLGDAQGCLTHAGLLLHRRGWQHMLSDQRRVEPFTQAE